MPQVHTQNVILMDYTNKNVMFYRGVGDMYFSTFIKGWVTQFCTKRKG